MKCRTGGCWVHDGHGGHTGVGCGCDCHTPPRPPEGKLGLTEIRGANGELVIMPESPLEITRRVNLHAKLIAALEEYHDIVSNIWNEGKECPNPNCRRCKAVKVAEALLREAAK